MPLSADPTDGGYDFIPLTSTGQPASGGETLNSPGFFGGLTNAFTGLLSKAVETAGDVLAAKGQQKIIGSVYPTGQNNPDAVKTANEKAKADAQVAPLSTQTILLISAAGVLALVGLVIATRKR